MINLNLNDDDAATAAGTKLHIGQLVQKIMHRNHPNVMPASDENSLLGLAFGNMPHPMSSAEISNRNVRR